MEELKTRKNIRLKGYNYSEEGYYFITICTQNRECILSKINSNDNVGAGLVSAQSKLTKTGKIIDNIYLNLEKEFFNVKLHDYIVMPNHIHGIIEIANKQKFRADTRPAPTIGDIICSFKSKTTVNVLNEIKSGQIKPFDKRLWQRNYYEHVIRNEKEYLMIKEYIINNPVNWEKDKYH